MRGESHFAVRWTIGKTRNPQDFLPCETSLSFDHRANVRVPLLKLGKMAVRNEAWNNPRLASVCDEFAHLMWIGEW
jgi:hypothetical protein